MVIYGIARVFGSGNTPLQLAMESGHGEAAVLLIEAGADRTKVIIISFNVALRFFKSAFLTSADESGSTGA